MKKGRIGKLITVLAIAIIAIIALITSAYSDKNNHYVVDIVNTEATGEDETLRIKEKILDCDSETLNYEVNLKNIKQNNQTRIAMVVDTSYSMKTNDTENVAKTKAKELASGIIDEVKNATISVGSNSGIKLGQTNNKTNIINAINGLAEGESKDCSNGLQVAYDSLSSFTATPGGTLNKVIIYFTDSTDSVSDKLVQIANDDPELQIISILLDAANSSYLNLSDGTSVGKEDYEVYILPDKVENTQIPSYMHLYETQLIYDELNSAANNIKVTNIFDDSIADYFNITNISTKGGVTDGTVTETRDDSGKIIGYIWEIDKLKFNAEATMNFTIKFKKDSEVKAEAIFNETYTNKTQDIEYNKYNTSIPEAFMGTDGRIGTESTSIKIAQGYDLIIKAVSESNSSLPVEGLTVKVIGENENGEEVCNIEKITNSNGNITITAEDARSLRADGEILYTVTPVNPETIIGYKKTDPIVFKINNNKNTKKLKFDSMGSNIEGVENETTRAVEVKLPIDTIKIDFEINAQELNNSNVVLSDCEFKLIQPKLNNTYEMSVLSGKTDSNGILHLSPTIMTKDGTYEYILEQASAPFGYDVTALTKIKIKFVNGRVMAYNIETNEIQTLYNENVKAFLDPASSTSSIDHIVVTAQDKCVFDNPFDLQINVSDADNTTTKLDGITYKVTTINSMNQQRSDTIVTDSNGQTLTKIMGNGYLTIKIEEQMTKPGYQDCSAKEIIILRQDNQVKLISAEPTNLYGTNLYQIEYIKDENGNPVGLQLNLSSQKKTEQNIVKVDLVDADDMNTAVGSNVVYDLIDENGNSYGPEASDENGELSFRIGNMAEGTHIYQLIVSPSSIPSEYDLTKIDSPIELSLDFNNLGNLVSTSKVSSNSSSVINESFETTTNEKNVDNIYTAKIAYTIESSNLFDFTIELRDEKNTGILLEDAKYNVNINYTTIQNGVEVVRTKKLVNRATNVHGKISTKILKGKNVKITVTETKPKSGYKLDSTEQEIKLVQNTSSGDMMIDYQMPYDATSTGLNKGAQFNTDNTVLTYHHYNSPRTSEDTYLNLNIIKKDLNLGFVNGVYVNVKSDKLLDGNGNPLNTTIVTGSQAKPGENLEGEVVYNYMDYKNGDPNSFTIRVPNLKVSDKISDEALETYYEFDITEMGIIDPTHSPVTDPSNLKEKPETKVTVRLIFRTLGGAVKLTNVETIYGNRLVINKEFSSASDSLEGSILQDEWGVYLANILLELYTNYEDVGNLAIDLKKAGVDGEELNGAKYDIRIVNPDFSVINKHDIEIKNGDDSDSIELKGVSVNEGSIIYLTETKEPIGYARNTNDETLVVTEIDEAGQVTLEQVDNFYNPARLELKQFAPTVMSNGKIKDNYEIKLIDYQLDVFKIGVDTIDSSTLGLVNGYNFKIDTSFGATGNVGSGLTTTVGGNPSSAIVEYTITPTQTATYYKPINTPIKAYVVFDASGNVDVAETMKSSTQTDPNYGTLWTITNLDATSVGNLRIQIKVNHQETLKVKVNTVDSITNNIVNNVSYKITPSIILPATGNNDIDVGYVLSNGAITYTLSQTNIQNDFEPSGNINFKLTYKNENIIEAEIQNNNLLEKAPTIQITGNREATITIYAESKLPFEITNIEYFGANNPLQGANFEIIEQSSKESASGTTGADGKININNAKFGVNSSKLYLVKNTKGSNGYATVEDFYVKVEFNESRQITSAKLVDKNENEITTNRFITVGYVDNTANNNLDNVKITVKSYPEFKINILDVDRRDGTTPVAGTNYSITSEYIDSDNVKQNFMSTSGVITDTTGTGIAHLDRTKDNTIVIYTIKEDSPAVGYQSIANEIKVKVSFDSDGFVNGAPELVDSQLANIAETTNVAGDAGNFEINLKLKNNPLLIFNLTTQDRTDTTNKLKDVGYQITAEYNSTIYSTSSATNKVNKSAGAQDVYSDINGLAIAYLDRTLENKEMIYTIKQTKKSTGYNWIQDSIKVKVTYDANGKIIGTVAISQGAGDAYIVSVDENNFTINLTIYNDEIEEFGIHLETVDTYDHDKKIDNLKVSAWLTETGTATPSYNSDGVHEFTGANVLWSGADRDSDGVPDIAHGEDYKSMGEYIASTQAANSTEDRILRLVINNQAPNGYYVDDASNNLGYYKGSQYFDDAHYQNVKYQWLIKVTFTEEGRIKAASIIDGLNAGIGWLADSRYLEVSHTDYKLNIKMKLFPMVELKLNAIDNYLKNIDGSDLNLNGYNYTISTQRHTEGGRNADEFVTAGYIGIGHNLGSSEHPSYVKGDLYEGTNTLYAPIENNYTRNYYVFENTEPTNYQKYSDRHVTHYIQRMVAIISLAFDEKGEIDYAHSIERHLKDESGNYTGTIAPIYLDESTTGYLSSNNLQEYRYTHTESPAKTSTTVSIGYALTTKLNVNAIDDITGDPISNIRLYPFANNTYKTNTSYEYNTQSYRTTGAQGQSSWIYWGAAENDGLDRFIIGSERTGNEYNGYLFPSDFASTSIGGSGIPQDYFAKLDVTYDSNGRISEVNSIGSDLWGDNNVANITFDPNTGTININMLYSRKFQTKLNKVDFNDNTIKLNATFGVISNKGLQTNISTSQKMVDFGKVYKNTTVKYTLSENQVPEGYFPITDTIDYYVTFDNNGDIMTSSIQSDSEYFGNVSTSSTTKNKNKTAPDLIINIKNKAAFYLDLRVIDKFYKSEGLENIYLNITNDKGDVAFGNPQTDANGYVTVPASPVYPGETVKYYISQTNNATGYYPNNTTIELEVTYNNKGTIQSYSIINGNEIVNNFNGSQFLNTKKIGLQIMNMPKDIKMGIYKYDRLNNTPISSVEFSITKTDLNTGVSTTTVSSTSTDTAGNTVLVFDTFATSAGGKNIKYNIHELNTPSSYRKTDDVEFIVKYNADGSMASYTNVLSSTKIAANQPTIDVAISGVRKSFNGEKVHAVVNVPNDNAFDLVIKNEDLNYAGFGIEGSTFNVSINGDAYNLPATNVNGITQISDITLTGDIDIVVGQSTVGTGYRDDKANNAVIKLVKGKLDGNADLIYSLDLDTAQDGFVDSKNATTTKAVIQIDEDYGKVYITFKNVTKTELTLLKQDYKDYSSLQGAEFLITGQQVNSVTGAPMGDPITITTDTNKITDSNGKLYFDLGEARPLQKWIYTFEEVTPPAGYDPIINTSMTVIYDQYGRITIEPSTYNRLNPRLENSNINCRSMIATIYNGDIPPAFTVKVYKKDVDSGMALNGASIYMNLTDSQNGNFIQVEKKTEASAQNGQTTQTANLGVDYKKYSDEPKNVSLIDKGLVYIDNIDFEGIMNIEVSETATPDGYVSGEQKTSGNVKIKATKIPQLNSSPLIELQTIDNDGLDVSVNSVTKEVKIVLYNESRFKININDVIYGTTPEIPIQGITYDITSDINTGLGIIPTTLNVTTPITDTKGNTSTEAGIAHAAKTVIYKLHQNLVDGYYPLPGDTLIKVAFDAKGNIIVNDCSVLTNSSYVTIEKDKFNEKGKLIEEGTKNKSLFVKVRNPGEIPNYKVQLEKHTVETYKNTETYDKLLEGAAYKITVHQEETGQEYTTFTGITNEFGLIDIPDQYFDGTGDITIIAEETMAPSGYDIANQSVLRLNRDPNTGNFTELSSNVDYKLINSNSPEYSTGQPQRVILKPNDKQEGDKFTLEVKKYSTQTEQAIVNNHAKFDATIIQEDTEGNLLSEDYIGELETDNDGRINATGLRLPRDEGIYKLILVETEAPKGFVKNEEPIEIYIEIGKDVGGFSIITDSYMVGIDEEGNPAKTTELIGDNPVLLKSSNQLINLEIGNNIIPGYKVQVLKHDIDAYDVLLEGATYKVTVNEEDSGNDPITFIETTDENGLIDVPDLIFNGFGYIKVTIQEMTAPDGYIKDGTAKTHRMFRSYETGKLSEVETNINYEYINTDSSKYVKWEPIKLILSPVNEQQKDKYSIRLSKYDRTTKELITEGKAIFNARLIKEDDSGVIISDEDLGTLETSKGKAKLTDLDIPKAEGEYKLIIKETQAPEGYRQIAQNMEIKVNIGRDDEGNYIIANAESLSEDVQIIKNDRVILLNVNNINKDEITDDEYSLDITKVDATTGLAIENMALFKVWIPDADNTAVYTETSQTKSGPGKLDYCFVEQDKDYGVRLTHMNKPASPGTLRYVFREIVPPTGYKKIDEDLILTLTFDYDVNGKIVIASATSSNTDYLRINTLTPCSTNQSFSVDILNTEDDSNEPLYLKSNEYLIGDKPAGWTKGTLTEYKTGDKYISKVETKTTIADFINNLDTNADNIVVIKPDGTMVNYNEYVGTAMTLVLTKGVAPNLQKIQIDIVVRGDVAAGKANGGAGDGKVTISDYTRAIQRQMKKVNLTEAFEKSIDFNDDGKLTIQDYTQELMEYKKNIK